MESNNFVVLVCGGREFDNRTLLFSELDRIHALHGITEIIHGNARGADKMSGLWADTNSVPHTKDKYTPEWDKYPPYYAPIKRNQDMLDENEIDCVVAFPGGNGTADMVKKSKIECIEHIVEISE